jgi:endoglucanase
MSVRHAVERGFLLAALAGLTMCDAPACRGKSNPPARKTHVPPGALASSPLNELLVVDQFGYRPDMSKVAIAASPVRGWNAAQKYEPSPELEVRRYSDGQVVFRGPALAWSEGAVDSASGDRGHWFDFSALRDPGTYVVYDAKQGTRSHPFSIAEDVYRDVLHASLRVFYFNRANIEKRAPFACVAKRCWTLARNYLGAGQDSEARSVRAQADASTAKDLTGGWWDAGDVNKYVTFARWPVHQLLTAYWENPAPFGDDYGIPESGNGIPDLLDEVSVEVAWLEKMQDESGGVLLKMGALTPDVTTPDRSHAKHYYYPVCSSSTITAAGMFAHAALAFRGVPALAKQADALRARAVRAFDHYSSHPRRDDCDDGSITGGDADRTLPEQAQDAVVASVYLFALTGEARYDEVVVRDHARSRPFQDERWSAYDPEQGDALLFYASLATANAAARTAILERRRSLATSVDVFGFRPEKDLYRAFLRPDSYHWGSNMIRANYGNANWDMLQFRLASADASASYQTRAEGLLHHFHGVNPLGLVYLSNMSSYGAEKSASELFHVWFSDGDERWDSSEHSELGPAPGYVPGGPNAHYCEEDQKAACFRSGLKQQPPGKAYRNFNTGWNPSTEYDRSWEITEPAIYYQAAYVKLLSKFVKN